MEILRLEGRTINKARFANYTAIIAQTQEEQYDMVFRLVDTGKKYGMGINMNKPQAMRYPEEINYCGLKKVIGK